ncbi:MAG TPA: hypothetical protein VEA99_18635 [Gemmatimonadaceae bacterium]|nr:hypothetical protein [Gemmatimonadaceae bacterium]
MTTERREGVFQVERTVRAAPLWVAGRVLEGSVRVGDSLESEGGRARFRVGGIDVYGRQLPEVVGGTVAALHLEPEPGASAAADDALARGARLSLAAAP